MVSYNKNKGPPIIYLFKKVGMVSYNKNKGPPNIDSKRWEWSHIIKTRIHRIFIQKGENGLI
jgi:hypothetical protein